jgi:hypothetical protein
MQSTRDIGLAAGIGALAGVLAGCDVSGPVVLGASGVRCHIFLADVSLM